MSENRQPKGTPVGGQFAASAHDEASSTLGYPEDRWDEANDLLSGYRSRVVDQGGDIQSDARDMLDALEAGEFDSLHTPESRREARFVLEEIASKTEDEARDIFYEEGSLLRVAEDTYVEGGKFNSLDDRLLYDLGDSMWSGISEAPTGAFTIVHDNGTHAVVIEDNSGFVTVNHFDTEEAAESAYEKLEKRYLDWEQEGEEFISIDTNDGSSLSVRHRPGGYSIHDDDENVIADFDLDSDEEMAVEEKARAVLDTRGRR